MKLTNFTKQVLQTLLLSLNLAISAHRASAQTTNNLENYVLNTPASEVRVFFEIPRSIGIHEAFITFHHQQQGRLHPLSKDYYLEALNIREVSNSRVEIEFGISPGVVSDYDALLAISLEEKARSDEKNSHWRPQVVYCPRPGFERLVEFELGIELGNQTSRFSILTEPMWLPMPRNLTLCNY